MRVKNAQRKKFLSERRGILTKSKEQNHVQVVVC